MNAVVFPQNSGQSLFQIKSRVVLEGVCSHCCHCGIHLRDAVSVERGIGPICSKKGYMDDPQNPDEIVAMALLGKWPELVQYLVDTWKPKGNKGLMNGLVRIASLNRKTEIHEAITDSLDALGYPRLASVLRETLCAIEVTDSKTEKDALGDSMYEVWVKRADFKWSFTKDLRNMGCFFNKRLGATIVPRAHKKQLWALLLKHYENLFVKVKKLDVATGKYDSSAHRVARRAKTDSSPPSAGEPEVAAEVATVTEPAPAQSADGIATGSDEAEQVRDLLGEF